MIDTRINTLGMFDSISASGLIAIRMRATPMQKVFKGIGFSGTCILFGTMHECSSLMTSVSRERGWWPLPLAFSPGSGRHREWNYDSSQRSRFRESAISSMWTPLVDSFENYEIWPPTTIRGVVIPSTVKYATVSMLSKMSRVDC